MATIDQLLREAYTRWDEPATLHRTGQELQDRNRLEDARAVLERALELDSTNTDSWAYLAYAHLRGGQYPEGLEVLRRGIQVTDADSLRATLEGFLEDEEELAALRQQLEGSEDPAAQAGALWRRFRAGETEEALSEVHRLATRQPECRDVRDMCIWMLMAAARGGKVDADRVRKEGLPLVEARITKEPDRIGGHSMKIALLEILQDHEAVLEETARALERFPDEETVMQQRGRAFRQTGDLDRALAWFSRAIGAKSSFVGARVELGKLYEHQQQYELAEEVFREIPVANPTHAPGFASLALFLARRERWDEAETQLLEAWPRMPEWFRGALRQNPDAQLLLQRPRVVQTLGEEGA